MIAPIAPHVGKNFGAILDHEVIQLHMQVANI